MVYQATLIVMPMAMVLMTLSKVPWIPMATAHLTIKISIPMVMVSVITLKEPVITTATACQII